MDKRYWTEPCPEGGGPRWIFWTYVIASFVGAFWPYWSNPLFGFLCWLFGLIGVISMIRRSRRYGTRMMELRMILGRHSDLRKAMGVNFGHPALLSIEDEHDTFLDQLHRDFPDPEYFQFRFRDHRGINPDVLNRVTEGEKHVE